MGRPKGSKNKVGYGSRVTGAASIVRSSNVPHGNISQDNERAGSVVKSPVVQSELETYLRGFNDARRIFEVKPGGKSDNKEESTTGKDVWQFRGNIGHGGKGTSSTTSQTDKPKDPFRQPTATYGSEG